MEDEIRRKILTLLDQHRIMTVATLRQDGWPQATTVGYVNEGFSNIIIDPLTDELGDKNVNEVIDYAYNTVWPHR